MLLAFALFLALAVPSLQFGDGTLVGPFGGWVARLAYGALGMVAYLGIAFLAHAALRVLKERPVFGDLAVGLGGGLGAVSLTVLFDLIGGGYRVAGHPAGGLVGSVVDSMCYRAVSTAGTVLLTLTGLFVAIVATTPLEMRTIGRGCAIAGDAAWRGLRFAAAECAAFVGRVVRRILPEHAAGIALEDDDDAAAPRAQLDGDTVRVDDPGADPLPAARTPKRGRKPKVDPNDGTAVPAFIAALPANDTAPTFAAAFPAARVVVDDTLPAPRLEPVIVEPVFHKAAQKEMKEKEKKVAADRPDFIPLGDGVYRMPPVSLLRYDDTGVPLDKEQMLEMSARLVNAFADYGVKGEVQAIRPGPVVTMYEFVPAPGTRVNKISNLADDLALRLEAVSIRIVAPIPGKAAVGIEVPNRQREIVYLKEIIADDVFQKARSKLTIALGKDIEGRPVAVDLAKMPHLLVAGTTGAGKSVAVNAMITSILYTSTPEDVRMIMIDPKMLELSIYEGIPHLLLPVVTDPKKANLALLWAVGEMERRYGHLAEAGVRDIGGYNRKVEMKSAMQQVEVAIEDDEGRVLENTTLDAAADSRQLALPVRAKALSAKKMPYIVVVIDEFADLMMCAPKEVEQSVARIAQKARACGIHLILATQRPSVDVITGLIKANFPSRIAFKVAQKNDSRTILDQNGAEALLGHGDMLFSDRGGAIQRAHGCLVEEGEIHAVVDFLKKQGKPVYDMDILKPREEDEGGEGGEDGGEDMSDDMYDKAVMIVAETRMASISAIQRRLRVGYNRAARMMDRMQKEGIVGPPDGQNRREVLIQAAG